MAHVGIDVVLYFTNTPSHQPFRETAMNATTTTSRPNPTDARVVAFTAASTARLGTRDRDFGVGYGKSSGYASTRRYASAPWAGPHFRVA